MWSENLPIILGLDSLAKHPCVEWEMPCFAEHTKQLIKNRINTNEKHRKAIDIKIPTEHKVNSGAHDNGWFRYVCEFIETDNGLCRVGFFQDISDDIGLTDQDSFLQDRVEMALAASNTGTWDYQVISNELFWDEKTHQIFATKSTTHPMKLSTWMRCLHIDSHTAFLDTFNVVNRAPEEDELIAKVFKFLSPSGEERFVSINARFYRDEIDQIVRIVGTCRDVTDRETFNHSLLEQATLAQKNEVMAEDANAARSRFIANVSHELRTPLNAVMGALQILQSFDFNDDIRAIVDMANSSSQQLLDSINDILDLAKADSQQLGISQVDINVAQIINNAIDKFRPQLYPNVQLTLAIPEHFDKYRLGDPIRFNQVINNLLSNAVKFTHQGVITVEVNGSESEVEVVIEDTGIGIDKEKLAIIFEPFRQSDESTTRQFGGSGIGLSISQALVRLMGGEISAHSSINEGATFRVVMPMPIIGNNVMDLGRNRLSDTVPDLSKHHILYAEDDDASVKVVKQLLRPTNAELAVAIDGKQALSLYRKNKALSLIILDLEMPIIDGLQVCERIRQENKKVPIIALTARVGIDDQKHYFNTGFTHIIEKPIMFDNFYKVLATLK